MNPWDNDPVVDAPWSQDQVVNQPKSSPLAALWQGLNNGLTFGASDEIQSGIAAGSVGLQNMLGIDTGGLTASQAYPQALESTRQDQTAAKNASPALYGVGAIAGSILPAIYTGGTGAGQALANFTRGSNLATRVGTGSALGALSGGAYGFNEGEGGFQERVDNAVPYAAGGAFLGGAVPAAVAGVKAAPAAARAVAQGVDNTLANVASKAANRFLPELDETSALLAQKAQSLPIPIPLYLDQVAESPALNNIQKISQELPFSGVAKRESLQNEAVMSNIAKSFGQDSNKITPNVIKQAYTDLGKQFNETFKDKTVTITPDVLSRFDNIVDEASQTNGSNVSDIVKRNVDYIKNNISDGVISGEKLNQIRSKISENIRNAKSVDGRAAQGHLGDLLDGVIDTAFDGLDPAAKQAFGDLRFKYKNLITVTPLAGKATRGNINPQLLENRVTRVFGEKAYANGEAGILGDVAKISKTFLPKKGGSDTIPKGLYAGGLAGVAAASNPALAVALAPNAALGLGANRLYQNAISNPNVVNNYVQSSLARYGQLAQDAAPLLIGGQ